MSPAVSYRGATLLELLVAVGIFSIVLIVVAGVYTRFILTQRRDIAERVVQEELRFGLELFNREVRTGFGSTYTALSDGRNFFFRNQKGYCIVYRYHNDRLERAQNEDYSAECKDATYTDYSPLTSKKLKVTDVRFLPQAMVGGVQGFVTIIIEAESSSATSVPPLRLQSTITSRQMFAFSGSLFPAP